MTQTHRGHPHEASDSKMLAIEVKGGKGDADALRLTSTDVPNIGPNEILIRVAAAGVNRPDVWQRMGAYPPPAGASAILGLEVSGVVERTGRAVSRWREGDHVVALLGGGGYAEFVNVDERHALPVPAGPDGPMDLVRAAALPETVFTVYANVFEAGHLTAGETFMIHGATSGIGATAIAMAKAAGARVIATARGRDKAMIAVRELGADVAIDTTVQDFESIAQDHGGVDVILDMVAGPYFSKNLRSLRYGGRLVQISFQGGDTVEANLRPIMQKSLTVTGSTLRGRTAAEKARLTQVIGQVVWPWIRDGKLGSRVDRVYPLSLASDAHKHLESGAHVGKIVLSVTSQSGRAASTL